MVESEANPEKADALLRPEKLKHLGRPFHRFEKFACEFGIPAPVLHGKGNYLAGMRECKGVLFVCLNSAWFCRTSRPDQSQLWLGLPQLESLLYDFDEARHNREVTVAVVHHPPEWFNLNELRQQSTRTNTYSYLAARSHAILSGHTHGGVEKCTRYYGGAWLFLNGASYTGSNYWNNFPVLQVDPNKREIRRLPWEWEPGKTPPAFIDTLYIKLMMRRTERGEAVLLEEALENPRLVIEGKPGSGKTTFLRWIAWNRCRPDSPFRGFPLWVRISELDQHKVNTLKERKQKDPTLDVDPRGTLFFSLDRGEASVKEFFGRGDEEARRWSTGGSGKDV